ncbi:MAG: DUF3098 domain-containing protein [Bacteroidales bacterium]|nr:DUF3098 domain-containing protein [Candidatus Hennigimonas equi]
MEDKKFAITPGGLRLMVVGLVVMVAGYILMCGPAVKDPAVFNYDMFDFRRIVAAPVVIVCGIIVEIVAIMRTGKKKE